MPRYTPPWSKQLALALMAPALWAGASAQSLTAPFVPTPAEWVADASEPVLAADATAPAAHHPDPAEAAATARPWLKGLQLGVVASHGRYREPGLMQTQGPRLGLLAAYRLRDFGDWQPTLQGQFQSSAMRYSSPISGELANVPDHETDLRLTALRSLGSAMQTPVGLLQASAYLGLGYRWHHNDLRGITTLGSVGYRRTNQRVYAPLGLQVSTQAPKVITASFEYTPTLHGLHTTHMTDIGATQDATVTQKSQGWALQVGWQFSPGWEFGLYHRQWNTQATAAWNSTRNGITQRYFEPASQWRDAGLKLSHQF